MNIMILFGPPYSGKGTQGERLALALNYKHVSTGELLRHEKQINSAIGNRAQQYTKQGLLAPDDLLETLVETALINHIDLNGIILDGYPRTISQAEKLFTLAAKNGCKIARVIFLDVEKNELVIRGMERGKTSSREDDRDEAIIQKRIEVYDTETKPVATFYQKYELVEKVHGQGSVNDITERIIQAVKHIV